MDEDVSLMMEFRDGNTGSFEKLVLKHRAKALSFAQRYIHNSYTAEDIIQECFAHIYVYKERYNNTWSFKTYLFTMIRNKCIDYIRKNKEYLYDMDVEAVNNITPEQILIDMESKNSIRLKIHEMKEDYKTIIYLIEYYNFSYNEAAKIMGKNVGQIKVLIYRARRKLKAIIEKEG